MAKTIDSIRPILSILGYWAIVLGSVGGPGNSLTIRQAAAVLPEKDTESAVRNVCSQTFSFSKPGVNTSLHFFYTQRDSGATKHGY